MDAARLRGETRAEHEAVEALLPLTGPSLTRELYGDVLVCMHGVVGTWEQWAQAHAPGGLAEMVHERKRTPLIEADLRFLGKPTGNSSWFVQMATLDMVLTNALSGSATAEATFLGAMYVMEGSTLGGQYIAQHVEQALGFQPGQGNAYFRGYGQRTGSMWHSFKEILQGLPDEYTPQVIEGAKGMFGYFGDAVRACHAADVLRS